MADLRYGACVGSWDRLARWVLPRVGDHEREFLGLSGQTSIAVAYNTILDAYAARHDGPVVLLHDDLEIIDPDFEEKVAAVLANPDTDRIGLVGVCGGTRDTTLAWWNGPTVGHQRIDGRVLDFGPQAGDVAIIEGSIMIFPSWAVRNLRFDTRYPGFHSYDEICLSALAAGRRVVVADIDTYHHVSLGFKSEASAQAWAHGEALFQQKWHGGQ